MHKFSIYFVRHAETLFNIHRRMQGWSDAPLTDKGIQQAKALGNHAFLKNIDYFVTSDLMRASDTLKLALEEAKLPIVFDRNKNLREFNFGNLEGKEIKEAYELIFDYNNIDRDTYFNLDIFEQYSKIYHPKHNETADTLLEFVERIETFLNNCIHISKKNNNNKILAVSHGITIQALVYHVMKDPALLTVLENVSVTRLDYCNGKFKVSYIGESIIEI